ncbi:MAG: hypothetical protein LBT06_11510 [Hungatella sp.]|jgi:hypothetical protein|nr:hypothetical protein [Hungatella sp.]
MDNNKIPKKVPVVKLGFRMLAGGYLIWTAYSLLHGMKKSTGYLKIVFILSAVVFAVTGILLVSVSAKKYLKGDYMLPGEEEQAPAACDVRQRESGDQESSIDGRATKHEGF